MSGQWVISQIAPAGILLEKEVNCNWIPLNLKNLKARC